jgi:hypothetical protein
MALSVEPTFNCLAVRHPSEMGPHRQRLEVPAPRHRIARRPARTPGTDRRRLVVIGARPSQMDQVVIAGVVAIGVVVLGFFAERV